MSKDEADRSFNAYDIKRLEMYSQNLVDYHLVIDLVPLLICYLFVIFYKIQGHEEVVPIDTEPNVNSNIISSIKSLWNKFTTWVNKD